MVGAPGCERARVDDDLRPRLGALENLGVRRESGDGQRVVALGDVEVLRIDAGVGVSLAQPCHAKAVQPLSQLPALTLIGLRRARRSCGALRRPERGLLSG
eukprot:7380556-Prymnesium_polylepis.2